LEVAHAHRLEADVEELARHFIEGSYPEKGADYAYRAGLNIETVHLQFLFAEQPPWG